MILAAEVQPKMLEAVRAGLHDDLGLGSLEVGLDPPTFEAPFALLSLAGWEPDTGHDRGDGQSAALETRWVLEFKYDSSIAGGAEAAKEAALRFAVWLRLNRMGLGEGPAILAEAEDEGAGDGEPGSDDIGIGTMSVSWTVEMDVLANPYDEAAAVDQVWVQAQPDAIADRTPSPLDDAGEYERIGALYGYSAATVTAASDAGTVSYVQDAVAFKPLDAADLAAWQAELLDGKLFVIRRDGTNYVRGAIRGAPAVSQGVISFTLDPDNRATGGALADGDAVWLEAEVQC